MFRFAAKVAVPFTSLKTAVDFGFDASFNLGDVAKEIFNFVFPKLLAFVDTGGIPVSTTQVEWLCAAVQEKAQASLDEALGKVKEITDELEGVIKQIKKIANGIGDVMGKSIEFAVDVPFRV